MSISVQRRSILFDMCANSTSYLILKHKSVFHVRRELLAFPPKQNFTPHNKVFMNKIILNVSFNALRCIFKFTNNTSLFFRHNYKTTLKSTSMKKKFLYKNNVGLKSSLK